MRISPLQIILGKPRKRNFLTKAEIETEIIQYKNKFDTIKGNLSFTFFNSDGSIDKERIEEEENLSKLSKNFSTEESIADLREFLLLALPTSEKKDKLAVEEIIKTLKEKMSTKDLNTFLTFFCQDLSVHVSDDYQPWEKNGEENYFREVFTDLVTIFKLNAEEAKTRINEKFAELRKKITFLFPNKIDKLKVVEKQLDEYFKKVDKEIALIEAKKEFQTRIEKLINDYNKFYPTDLVTAIENKSSKKHWGDGSGRGSSGATWQKYLQLVNEIEGDGDSSLPFAKNNIVYGVLEGMVPALLEAHLNNTSPKPTKKNLQELIKEIEGMGIASGKNYFTVEENANLTFIRENEKLKNKKTLKDVINSLEEKSLSKDWSRLLNEIYNFSEKNKDKPSSPNEIHAEVTRLKGLYEDPLEAVRLATDNFKMASYDVLRSGAIERDLSAIPAIIEEIGDKEHDDKVHRWKEYIALRNGSEGNCFLAALAILLVGENYSTSTKIKELEWTLRATVCFEIMTNPKKYFSGNEKALARQVHQKLSQGFTDEELPTLPKGQIGRSEPMARNGAFFATDDIKFFSSLLGRDIKTIFLRSSWEKYLEEEQRTGKKEVWGMSSSVLEYPQHRPLIIQRLTREHFASLVPKEDNREGRFGFIAKKIEWSEEKGNEWISFEVEEGGFRRNREEGIGLFGLSEAGKELVKIIESESGSKIEDQIKIVIYCDNSPIDGEQTLFRTWLDMFIRENRKGEKIHLDLYRVWENGDGTTPSAREKNLSLRIEKQDKEIHMNWQNVADISLYRNPQGEHSPLHPHGNELEKRKNEFKLSLSSVGLKWQQYGDNTTMPSGSALSVGKPAGTLHENLEYIIHAIPEGVSSVLDENGLAIEVNADRHNIINAVKNTIILAGRLTDSVAIPLIGGGVFWSDKLSKSYGGKKVELAKDIILSSIYQRKALDRGNLTMVFVDYKADRSFELAFEEIKTKFSDKQELIENIRVVNGDIIDCDLHKCNTIVNASNSRCQINGMAGTARAISSKVTDPKKLDEETKKLIESIWKDALKLKTS